MTVLMFVSLSSFGRDNYCDWLVCSNKDVARVISVPFGMYGISGATGSELSALGRLNTMVGISKLAVVKVRRSGQATAANPFSELQWRPHELKTVGESGPLSLVFCSTFVASDRVAAQLEIQNTGRMNEEFELSFEGSIFPRNKGRLESYSGTIEPLDDGTGIYIMNSDDFWATRHEKGFAVHAVMLFPDLKRFDHFEVAPDKDVGSHYTASVKMLLKAGERVVLPICLGMSDQNREQALAAAKQASRKTYSEWAGQRKKAWNEWFASLPQIAGDDDETRMFYRACSNLRQNLIDTGGRYTFKTPGTTPDKEHYYGNWQWDSILMAMGWLFIDEHVAQQILLSYHGRYTVQDQAPLEAWLAWRIYETSGDLDWLKEVYPRVAQNVKNTVKKCDPAETGLLLEGYLSGHGIMHGLIGESRVLVGWHGKKKRALYSVGASALLVNEYECLSKISEQIGNPAGVLEFKNLADRTRTAINEKLWDEDVGFFYNASYPDETRVPVLSGQSFTVFMAGGIPESRMKKMLGHLDNESEFRTKLPIPTIAINDPQYQGSWWDGAVWTVVDYLTWEGLLRNGYRDTAYDLAERLLETLAKNGMLEYADPNTGKPMSPICQFGWTSAQYVEIFLHHFCGISIDDGNLSIEPASPGKARTVRGFRFRNTTFDFVYEGSGNKIGDITVDGTSLNGNEVPTEYVDGKHHVIKIVREP